MMKRLIIYIVLGFSLLLLTGCSSIPVAPPITPDLPDLEEEYNIITEIGGSAAEEYLNFEDTYGEEQALQNTVDYLNQQEGIENVSLDEESGTISFEFENGHLGIIATYDVTKSPKLEAGKGEPPLPIEGIKHLLKGTPTKKKALLLNPFPTILGNSTQYIKGKLKAIEYQRGYYEGEAVTVELMKNMEEYGIIYIDTHGGVVNSSKYGEEIYFVIGQKGNKQLYEKYASDLQYLYLAHFWVPSFSLSHYFAILPHFIGRYAETSYPNSLIYIDACNSYKNPTMAAAFVEEGAYVYCGYSSFIMAWNYSEQTVFDNMIDEAMTIQEAVNEVGASNLHFHPEEGGNFYLVEEVDDETKIENVIHELAQALSDKDWNKARSCCIYGSEAYNEVNELEDLINEWEFSHGTTALNINENINNVVINGKYAIVYGYFSYIFTAGSYVEEYSGDATGYLEKIGNNWEIYEGYIPNL